MTQDQILTFQRAHCNHLGHMLTQTGVMDKATRWAWEMTLQIAARQEIVTRAIGAAYAEVQEVPKGSNRGELIDFWLERCGLPIPPPGVAVPDHAWCAAFASWCISVPGYPEVKFARVFDLVRTLPHIDFEQLKPGDLGYILRENGTGHVWIVTGKEGDQTMNVEGNTNDAVRVTLRPRAKYLRSIPDAIMPCIPPGVPLAGTATR